MFYFKNLLLLVVFTCATIIITFASEPDMFQLVGFATNGDGTTGGAGGTIDTVYTGTELQQLLKDKQDISTPMTIYIGATITIDNSPGLSKIDIKEIRDVSILGLGTLGVFDGIGLKVYKAGNIIIRNVKVYHVLSGDKDCISIEGPTDHIWVDHCELYNEYYSVDKDYYDGLLDAKGESEYLTYSWNYLHDSWKAMLCGSSESDTYDRKLTMHHNWFKDCNSRLPLFRGGTGHFFNNFYDSIISTGMNSRIGACVKIENNYFKNTNDPFVSAFSDVVGYADTIGNLFDNCTWDFFQDDIFALTACTPSIDYEYSEVLHNASEVPNVVMMYAGVGKLDLGPGPFYSINKNIIGSGLLSIDPVKALYDSGDVVTITATPGTYWEFEGWSGDETGTTNPIEIIMNKDYNLTATFTTDKVELRSMVSGPGTIDISPKQTMYDSGASVTITATPLTNAEFVKWAGDITGTENPLTFSIDSNMNVTALFKYASTNSLTIQVEESYCDMKGSVETEHVGFNGSGFIDYENETGSNVDVAVYADSAVSCNLTIRYAHGKTDDRSLAILINDVTVIANLDIPSTGAFTTYSTVSTTLNLVEGYNMISLVGITSNGGPNLDELIFTTKYESISPALCDDTSEVVIPVAITGFNQTENIFDFYPNPATNSMNLVFELYSQDNLQINIINMTGLRNQIFNDIVIPGKNHNLSIDISGYAPGIYLVEMRSSTFNTSKRMIINR